MVNKCWNNEPNQLQLTNFEQRCEAATGDSQIMNVFLSKEEADVIVP